MTKIDRKRDWEIFEQWVMELENTLGQEATVTRNAYLIDRNGNRREIDVLVEFRGSGRDWLHAIECRKRDASPDVTWIDQIKGKYDDLPQVHRITAVSHSGFTNAAIGKAEAHGIETLTLHETDTADWQIKFAIKHLEVLMPHVDYINVSLVLDCDPEEEPSLEEFAVSAPVFRVAEKNMVSLHQPWQSNIQPSVVGEGPPQEREPMPVKTVLQFTEECPCDLLIQDETFPVDEIRFDVMFQVKQFQNPLRVPMQYASAPDGTIRAGLVEAIEPVETANGPALVSFHYLPPSSAGGEDAMLVAHLRPVHQGAEEITENGIAND